MAVCGCIKYQKGCSHWGWVEIHRVRVGGVGDYEKKNVKNMYIKGVGDVTSSQD